MAGDLGAVALILSVIDNASAAIANVQNNLGGLMDKAKELGKFGAETAALGAAIMGPDIAGVKEASDKAYFMARLAEATYGDANATKELADADKFATEWALKHVQTADMMRRSVEQGLDASLKLADAERVTATAAALAEGAHGDLKDTMDLLLKTTYAFETTTERMGGKTADAAIRVANALGLAQQKFQWDSITELNSAMTAALPVFAEYSTSVNDATALLSALRKGGLAGATSGYAVAEMAAGIGKMHELGIPPVLTAMGGVDLPRSLLAVREALIRTYGDLAHMPLPQLEKLQGVFGIEGMKMLLLNTETFNKAVATMNAGGGSLTAFQQIMEATPGEQWQILKNNIGELFTVLGDQLLPVLSPIIVGLIEAAQWMNQFARAHPALVKFVGVFTAIAGGVLVVVGTLAVLAAAVVGAVAAIGVVAGWVGLSAIAFIGLWVAAAAIGAALIAWGPALEGFLAKIPGVAAFGNFIKDRAIMIYNDFAGIFTAVYNLFTAQTGHFEAAGKALLIALGKGLWDLTVIGPGVVKLAEFILGHFPRSPAKYGPLRELGDIRISETIADTMRPQPIITAARKVALAGLMAAPMLGAPMGASAIAAGSAGYDRGGMTINFVVNVSADTIVGEDGLHDLIVGTLKDEAPKVADILERETTRRARRSFR